MRQANPKKAGSKSALRYDAYKPATTASEFLRLGGSKADLAHDCAKGFVAVVVEAERAAPVPPRSDPVVDRYDAGRLRDEAVRAAPSRNLQNSSGASGPLLRSTASSLNFCCSASTA